MVFSYAKAEIVEKIVPLLELLGNCKTWWINFIMHLFHWFQIASRTLGNQIHSPLWY